MRAIYILITGIFLVLAISIPAMPQEAATPEEVIAKVREAAEYLTEKGDAALAEFNDPKGAWVWKDTYVFVMDCDNDVYVGHPMKEVLEKKISETVDYAGSYVGVEECKVSNNPNGGWVEIMWPKIGSTEPVRKICYVLRLPGQRYTVGSGIYEPEMTLDELNNKLK
ncbi:MAG: cache domain-containing protein [Deltaproteobacteria bacterium]|uniref:Cache domain-containing protein n=1 Tax=Candidatus Zymogenus saltonus TaxID=2844893 RepID=A0A9D8KI85_9DELT|nr:cache domain-containing protein [Candidatus Zymogenus saltonus]